MDWYLHSERAGLIFRAFTTVSKDVWDNTVTNTNAQEGTGKDIKYTAHKQRLTFIEAIDHMYRYVTAIELDHMAVKTGHSIRYKSKPTEPPKPTQTAKVPLNDGRPPIPNRSIRVKAHPVRLGSNIEVNGNGTRSNV